MHSLGLLAILDNTNVESLDLEDAVDLVYVLREVSEKYKKLKTNIERKYEQTSTLVAERMASENTQKMQTEYVSVDWDYNASLNVPSKLGKDGYVETLKSLGVPDATIALDIIRLHYPNYCQYLKDTNALENATVEYVQENIKVVPKLKLRKKKDLENVE